MGAGPGDFGFGGGAEVRGSVGTRSRAGSQEEKLIEDLRRRRAEEIAVYAGVDAFCRYDYWRQDDLWEEDLGDTSTMQLNSWFTQIAAWIQEDVVATIKATNGGSESVAASAIKRLISISFSAEESSQRQTSSKSRGGADGAVRGRGSLSLPEYVTSLKKQTRQSGSSRSRQSVSTAGVMWGNMVESWTGRVSDGLLDVVHFEVAVVVDTSRITDFLGALREAKYTVSEQDGRSVQTNKRNQIVVLQISMEPVDVEVEQQSGYYYGPASVAVLRVACEYSFFREGYVRHMPASVKELLSVTAAAKTSGGLGSSAGNKASKMY